MRHHGIRLRRDYAEAHFNLGLALELRGQTDEAISHFEEALRLKPDYGEARKKLDAALANRARSLPPSGSATTH